MPCYNYKTIILKRSVSNHGTCNFRRMHRLRLLRGSMPRQRYQHGRRQVRNQPRRVHRLRRVRSTMPRRRNFREVIFFGFVILKSKTARQRYCEPFSLYGAWEAILFCLMAAIIFGKKVNYAGIRQSEIDCRKVKVRALRRAQGHGRFFLKNKRPTGQRIKNPRRLLIKAQRI